MSSVANSTNVVIGSPTSIQNSVDAWQQQNMSPSEIFTLGNSIPQTLSGIPGVGSRIPALGKIPIPGATELNKVLAPITTAKFGVAGEFETIHYADDLNLHQPKFKFLFKVLFSGFSTKDFYFYVYRCDKPKVKFNHVDVNYYNFRTRVLTNTVFEPLQITFLDEIGNSVNEFFSTYLSQTSGQGSGNYGIDRGWGASSSTIPYANGYSATRGQKIVIEQIFISTYQGPAANRFTFLNPRIETFEFDELGHEESNTGSMAMITFSYDAIQSETVNKETLYSWGKTDLFKAGGTSGVPNNSETNGAPMFGNAPPVLKQPGVYDALRKGSDLISSIPSALSNILTPVFAGPAAAISSVDKTIGTALNSAVDVVSLNVSTTLTSIVSGSNAVNGGKAAIQNQSIVLPAKINVNIPAKSN